MLPTSTNVTLSIKSKLPNNVGAVATFLTQGAKESASPLLTQEDRRAVARLLAAGVVRGKAKELAFDLVDAGKGNHRRVYVIGIGQADKVTAETIRQAAGHLAKALRKHRIGSAAVALPEVETVPPAAAAEAVATGVLLARFRYDEYKGAGQKTDDKDRETPLDLTVLSADAGPAVKQAIDRARAIADGQNFCRTIATRPGNNINPPTLAKVAQELAREVGLDVRVLDEKQMAKLGMGGILAVGQGSANPPRMIVLQHRPGGIAASRARAKAAKKLPVLLVVGKAITFDTGGISIKPAERMG